MTARRSLTFAWLLLAPGCVDDVAGAPRSDAGALGATDLDAGVVVGETDAGPLVAEHPPCEVPAPEPVVERTPCDGVPLVIDESQIAASPREDRVAEALAASLSEGFAASAHDYERVRCELERMRALLPAAFEEAHGPGEYETRLRARDADRHVWLEVGTTAAASIAAGDDADWRCVSEALRADVTRSGPYVIVESAPVLKTDTLLATYAALPGVEQAFADWSPFETPIVVRRAPDKSHQYVVVRGLGDCPSGCMQHDYFFFTAAADGTIAFVDRWSSTEGGERPEWASMVAGWWENP